MFRIMCYMNGEVVDEIIEKDIDDALLLAQILFNSGYSRVEVYNENMELIETI